MVVQKMVDQVVHLVDVELLVKVMMVLPVVVVILPIYLKVEVEALPKLE